MQFKVRRLQNPHHCPVLHPDPRIVDVPPDHFEVTEDDVLLSAALDGSLAVCLYDAVEEHGALLHLFYPTFGIYRPAQDSAAVMDEGHRFHNLFQIMNAGDRGDVSEYENKGMRAMPGADSLADTRVIEFKDDYQDGVSLTIQSLFPNVVLQQIQNSLAIRLVVPLAVDKTELYWILFGYADDTPEQRTAAYEQHWQRGGLSSGGGYTLQGACAGTTLGLGSSGLRLVKVFATGADGEGRLTGVAPPFACGGYLQMVVADGNPCTTSNVVQIPQ